MLKKLKQLGPGILIAAAFIGPGTVTTATIAGAAMGYTLLWAILFSIIATIVLQEMSARLGLIANKGVGEALREKYKGSIWKIPIALLVISAILIGNAAYEAGNITGAVMGFDYFSDATINPLVLVIAILAFFLLYSGKYKLIERFIFVLVSIMGVVFLVSAILLQPDVAEILKNLFIPSISENSILMVVGLIGTTVVPYNLFLHASSAKEKWKGKQSLLSARIDTILSISLGGIITMAVLITAAVAFQDNPKTVENFKDLSIQLQGVLGSWSSIFIAFGFLAAGISSAVTAPLAAAFATSEILGWKYNLKSKRFRIVWATVLGLGTLFSSLGYKPTAVILFAQVANGILLPVIAIFLLWVMNDKKLLGKNINGWWSNGIAILIILVSIGLGCKSIFSALGKLN